MVFQPSIAGLDQAGIVEIAAGIVNHGLAKEQDQISVLGDVFLTGGNTMFTGFDERLKRELRAVLPIEAPIKLRKAKDQVLDAWRGAAQWAASAESKQRFVTREEFQEKGSEYLKVS